MKKVRILTFLFLVLIASNTLSAQGLSGQQLFVGSLVVIGILVFLWVILMTSDNLMQIEAKKLGADTGKGQFSLFPNIRTMFGKSIPAYVGKTAFIKLDKGYDIKLAGKAEEKINPNLKATTFAVKPTDFHGISPIPKVIVEQGQSVKAGEVLFFDKKRPDVKYVAPVSGEIVAVNRGEKRAIAEVVILASAELDYLSHEAPDISKASIEELKTFMQSSGLWALLNERPFDMVPGDELPANIFVSTFDTSPYATNKNIALEGRAEAFQKGLDVLAKFTEGKVYMGLNANGAKVPSSTFTNAQGIEKVYFKGAHPAGNVGVQMHHLAPIGRKKAWTVPVQAVAQIGEMFLSGKYDASRVFSVNGSGLETTGYVHSYMGANVGEILESNIKSTNYRVVSGSPLSGHEIVDKGFIGFHDDQITVLEEGDDYELFGWLIPVTPRPSVSGTFPNFMYRNHDHLVTTNTHGERRAFVMTGQYEKVLPMDIYPQHLMKAVLNGDIEKMEGLGINELTEEDLALCEFVCTSKMPLQAILRDGLDLMREQG